MTTNLITVQAADTFFSVRAQFTDAAERDAFVALFPKYVGFIATTCGTYDGDNRVTFPVASMEARLSGTKSNGGVNETGIARALKALQVLDKTGTEYKWTQNWKNSVSREIFLESVGAAA